MDIFSIIKFVTPCIILLKTIEKEIIERLMGRGDNNKNLELEIPK